MPAARLKRRALPPPETLPMREQSMQETAIFADLPTPADGVVHHEDLPVGAYAVPGEKRLSKEEIIAFGRAYDPQPFHVDEEAAKHSMLGTLIASGYHNCAILMRLLCDGLLNQSASQGSPGLLAVKWAHPLRPGDVLTARFRVLEKRTLASRPHIGLSRLQHELLNQNGQVAMTWDGWQFLKVRNPAPIASPGAEVAREPREGKPARPDLWAEPARERPEAEANGNFFEDRAIGETMELGSHRFEREDIFAFARAHDPQPFHLDEAAAKASIFGGLSASGWQTAANYIRCLIDHRQAMEARMRAAGIRHAAWGPSPGFENLEWIKPVLVGDTVSYRARIIDKIDLKSRPDRGLIKTLSQGRNQRGEIVFSVSSIIFAERRERFQAPAV
jgi:acyl dehydratase